MKTPEKTGNSAPRLLTFAVVLSWLFLFSILLASCSQAPDEEQITQNIKSMQEALENRQTADLMALLHPDFTAQEKMDREQLKALVTLQFIRHQNINVMMLSLNTSIDENYDYRALSRGTAIITGASQLVPDDGRIYHFTLDWRKSGDEWLLRNLDWE